MRDAVNLSRRNIPAVALVTSEFWAQGDFIARAAGLPDVPRVQLPHPVASTGRDNMRRVALDVRDAIVTALQGPSVTALQGPSVTALQGPSVTALQGTSPSAGPAGSGGSS